MATSPERVYFPNLDGLRFIAALLVIVTHVEQYSSLVKLPNSYDQPWAPRLGQTGVILFFVLSGFLITYLLLNEKNATGTIALRNFYLRRILRIWPLYYWLCFLAFIALPAIPFLAVPGLEVWSVDRYRAGQAALYLGMAPNLSLVFYPPVLYAAQAWSVGVEEQFYLIWPLLARWCRNTSAMLIAVIAGYLLVKASLILGRHFAPLNRTLGGLQAFWNSFNIDCMAAGGLMALALLEQRRELNWLFRPTLQYATYAGTLVLLAIGFNNRYNLQHEVYGMLFAVIIVNLAGNTKSVLRLEAPWLSFLGRISYGLYMYHAIAIVIAIRVLTASGLAGRPALYLLTMVLTIAMSQVSYTVLEGPFLRRKPRSFTTSR